MIKGKNLKFNNNDLEIKSETFSLLFEKKIPKPFLKTELSILIHS